MSPFDMFVIAFFIIIGFKATLDTLNFWKESEDYTTEYFQIQDERAKNQLRKAAIKKPRAVRTRLYSKSRINKQVTNKSKAA